MFKNDEMITPAGVTSGGPQPEGEIQAEARIFGRYLFGREIPDALLSRYVAALGVPALRLAPGTRPIDGLLLRAGRRSRLLLRIADSYASIALRGGALRRRLVLLLALLETHRETHREFLLRRPGSRAWAWVFVLFAGASGVLLAMVSVLLFGPIHVVSTAFRRRRKG